jgi:hypothetical protein
MPVLENPNGAWMGLEARLTQPGLGKRQGGWSAGSAMTQLKKAPVAMAGG